MRPVRTSQDIQLGAAVACILATGISPDLLGSGYWSYSFQLVNILIVVAVAQNFLLYDANQVSFGQGAIFGIGAYLTAMLLSLAGLPWLLAAAGAIIGAGIGGLIYAIPALRVQGYYLGFITLSVAMVFPELLFMFDDYTNGINGISTPAGAWKDPLVFGITPLSLVTAGFACAAVIGHVLVRRSAFGRKVRVAGASPESAQTLGIRPGLVRCIVFCACAAVTGAAGALYPPIVGFVSPAAFHLELSILVFLAVIVGGRGQIFGPLAGIYLLHLLPDVLLVDLADYRLLAYGVVALVVMLLLPDGLIGSLERRFRSRTAGGTAAFAPDELSLPADMPRPPAARASSPAVAIRGVSKWFGAVCALDTVEVDIGRGRIVGLVGANGSGKTSLINVITGFSRPSGGSVSINGEPIAGCSPASIARLGVGRTFQTPRIFDALTAWENIHIGAEASARPAALLAGERLEKLRRRFDVVETGTIPHGPRRVIELMRVILTGADLLLLDEPAAGLSQEERQQLSSLLVKLRDDAGKTILLVEHDLRLVWSVADEVVVMEAGKVVAQGAPSDIKSDPAVRKLFIEPAHA